MLRFGCWRSDGVLSAGTFNRDFYIRDGMKPGAIRPAVIPADTSLYSLAPRRDRPETGLAIGFAGKPILRKGVHELLAAIALLPPRSWRSVR